MLSSELAGDGETEAVEPTWIVIANLYNINVRKVVQMGLPPVGCAPHFRTMAAKMGNASTKSIKFNDGLRCMSSEFIRQYPDSVISYCDTFEGSVDILENRDRYGE